MKMKSLIGFGLMVFAAASAKGASSWFQVGSVSATLAAAHESFLAKDYVSALEGIKKVFEDNPQDGLQQRNALDLYKSITRAKGDTARPEGTSLPKELRRLEITVGRRERSDSVNFSLKLSGDAVAGHEIVKQVSVTSHTGEVVLDKDKDIGEWETDTAPGEEGYFELANFDLKSPPKEGLYYLHIEFTGGVDWNGWVILSDLLASTSPEVKTPIQGQVVRTATPTITWTDYRSPEYQPSERRVLWVAVAKSNPYERLYSFWRSNPTIERVTVPNNNALEDGQYVTTIAYTEKRPFGEITVGRSSATMRRFVVKLP